MTDAAADHSEPAPTPRPELAAPPATNQEADLQAAEHHHAHAAHLVRHCDVVVVGGSAAGLAAALQLGRQRRSVIVVDAGDPRNATAGHMHSVLGREGQPPALLLADGRDEVRSYGGEILRGRVTDVERTEDGRLRVHLGGPGPVLVARRVLLATGVTDELPDVEGLGPLWGGAAIHCPFCHGYEARDRRIVQLITHPMGLHQAPLWRQLTDDLTVVLGAGDDTPDLDTGALQVLRDAGIEVLDGPAERVVTDDDGTLLAVELRGGRQVAADVLAIAPRFRARTAFAASLGLEATAHPTGLGDAITVDEMGHTAVAGVHAAGNVTDPSMQVMHAAAHGARVAGAMSYLLADEDLRAASRRSASAADWDHRYGGEQMWSGRPNGTLVDQMADITPAGRTALDVGAGEGGDAVWLAEQGWQVTAADISRAALERVEAAATERALDIVLLHADVNAAGALPASSFDLVTAHYASIPRTPDDRGARALVGAVSPGGVLLVVSHDLAPMRQSWDEPVPAHAPVRPFDPDAYVTVDDVVRLLDGDPEWEIELHELRPRPGAHDSASPQHIDDLVLRARRRENRA